MRSDIPERRSHIEAWIAEHRSKAFMCRELRCKPATLESYLTRMGISYAGNMSSKGRVSGARVDVQHYLYNGSLINSHPLKLRLLRDKVKERRCERCGRSEWMDEPIPLELHHVNGKRFDNRLKNLQLLCPNCHALTDNHAGRGTLKSFRRASFKTVSRD